MTSEPTPSIEGMPEIEFDPAVHMQRFLARTHSAGHGAEIDVLQAEGPITEICVRSGGQGYVAPRALVTGGGLNALVELKVKDGVVTDAEVAGWGAGYKTSTTTIRVVDGPVVVLAGETLSLPNPAGLPEARTPWHLLQQEISRHYPDRAPVFYNRAMPGMAWSRYASTRWTEVPDWQHSKSKAWGDYLKELRPDLLVFALGTNDRKDFTPHLMVRFVEQFRALPSPPDIVFITPPITSASHNRDGVSDPAAQSGLDQVAGYMRGYARLNGIGLLDVHRRSRSLRDGIDVCRTTLRPVFEQQRVAMPFVADTTGWDSVLEVTFDRPVDWWQQRVMRVLISPKGKVCQQYCDIDWRGGERVEVSVEEVGGKVPQRQIVQAIAVSRADPTRCTVRLEVRDQQLRLLIDGRIAFDAAIYRMGGAYAPEFRVVPADRGEVIASLWVGDPVQTQPKVDDETLYGPANRTGPYAGIVPTMKGMELLYGPTLRRTPWSNTNPPPASQRAAPDAPEPDEEPSAAVPAARPRAQPQPATPAKRPRASTPQTSPQAAAPAVQPRPAMQTPAPVQMATPAAQPEASHEQPAASPAAPRTGPPSTLRRPPPPGGKRPAPK